LRGVVARNQSSSAGCKNKRKRRKSSRFIEDGGEGRKPEGEQKNTLLGHTNTKPKGESNKGDRLASERRHTERKRLERKVGGLNAKNTDFGVAKKKKSAIGGKVPDPRNKRESITNWLTKPKKKKKKKSQQGGGP